MSTSQTPVLDFYRGGKILLTGATGFLGKTLIYKFLHSKFDINCIYIIIRVKKGKDPHSRMEELFQDPIFESLQNKKSEFMKKIICIPGDISCLKLGLSEEHYELLTREVTHVIHAAATVRFNEKLKSALKINVLGSCEIVNLCNQCTRLKVLVYVSTAFSHNYQEVIEEKLKKPPLFTQNALNFLNSLSEEQMDSITQDLIKPWPNTYAYTKAIAENCVKELARGYPVVIFRPAIVMGACKEPLVGWTDNLYGPTGIVVGVGAGLIRTCLVNVHVTANLVPVDMTINALLCAGWEKGRESDNCLNKANLQPKFYNFVPVESNRISWGYYLSKTLNLGLQIPVNTNIWYYTVTVTKYKLLFILFTIFFQFLPGAIMDGGSILIGKKPQLIKAYKKIYNYCDSLQTFSINEWRFSNDNVMKLWNNMSEDDKKLFYFNMGNLDWEAYLKNVVIGVRKFIFKEDESTLPRARRKLLLFWFLHRLLQMFLLGMFILFINKFIFPFNSFAIKPAIESYVTSPKTVGNFS